jgi:hypothetical protein
MINPCRFFMASSFRATRALIAEHPGGAAGQRTPGHEHLGTEPDVPLHDRVEPIGRRGLDLELVADAAVGSPRRQVPAPDRRAGWPCQRDRSGRIREPWRERDLADDLRRQFICSSCAPVGSHNVRVQLPTLAVTAPSLVERGRAGHAISPTRPARRRGASATSRPRSAAGRRERVVDGLLDRRVANCSVRGADSGAAPNARTLGSRNRNLQLHADRRHGALIR